MAVTYNTPNGTQTDATMEQQLRNAGWQGGENVADAYARTTGGTVTQVGGAPSPTTPAPTPGSPVVPPDLSGYVAALQASSGLSIKQLEEQKREFDATLAHQVEVWRQQGLPELAIKQRSQDLEEAKFKELTDQAHFTQNLQTRQQDLNEQVQLGQLSIAQAQAQLAREVQTGQLRVAQGQLGLDTLKTAASLSGPENWIQAANFNRGVRANSVLPGFVSDLLTGRSTAAMGGPAAGAEMSQPLSLDTMANAMGATGAPQAAQPQATPAQAQPGATLDPAHMGQFYFHALNAANTAAAPAPGAPAATPATPGAGNGGMATASDVATAFGRTDQVDPSVAALRQVYAQGGQALGPQQMEGLTPTESKMFTGGGAAIGADVPGFAAAYQRSRIGQTAAQPAMAA